MSRHGGRRGETPVTVFLPQEVIRTKRDGRALAVRDRLDIA